MKIINLFSEKKCVFSIEVFPPKQEASFDAMLQKLDALAALKPDFISVTYGAGGSAAGRGTADIADYLKNTLSVEPLAHLTCVNSSRDQIGTALDDLRNRRIENILALRGDKNPNVPPRDDFHYASELAQAITEYGGFSLAGACYPEGHVESASLARDVESLQYKIDAGVSHLITQLFFDNGTFYRFLNLARKAGITVPVQAGVMPIVNVRQISRTVALSSASLPHSFTKMISRWEHDEQALFDAGIDYAISQIRDLITGGADGVHLYAMNNPEVARRVYDGVSDLLEDSNA